MFRMFTTDPIIGLVKASAPRSRAVHDQMKAKALTLAWLKTFFDGDSAANPKEFDGLNKRLTGDQVITAGANGAPLDLDMLDKLVDAVRGTPSMLLMNKAMRRAVVKLARGSSVLSVGPDLFGREVTSYSGVPMAVVEEDAQGNDLLGFDEAQGTDAATASIYAARFAPDMLHGIQTAPVSVRDLGEIEVKPALRTRIEWYSGLVIKHPRAVARLKGVKKPT